MDFNAKGFQNKENIDRLNIIDDNNNRLFTVKKQKTGMIATIMHYRHRSLSKGCLYFMLFVFSVSIFAKTPLTDEQRLRAEKFFFEKKYYAALDYFQEVSRENSEDYRAHRFAGDSSLALGKYAAAQEFFMRAREFSPNPELDFFRLGQIKYLQNDKKKAISYLMRASKKKNLPLALFYMGLCHYKFYQDKAKTIEYWEEYVATKPADEIVVRKAIEILKRKKGILPLADENGDSSKKDKESDEAHDASDSLPIIDKHFRPEEILPPN